MPKIILQISQEFLAEVDQVAADEHRNRSDLVREAMRSHIDRRKRLKAHNAAAASGAHSAPLIMLNQAHRVELDHAVERLGLEG